MVSHQKIRGVLKKLGYASLLGHSVQTGRSCSLATFYGVIEITQGFDGNLLSLPNYSPKDHPVFIKIVDTEDDDAKKLLDDITQKLNNTGYDAKVVKHGVGYWESLIVEVREKRS